MRRATPSGLLITAAIAAGLLGAPAAQAATGDGSVLTDLSSDALTCIVEELSPLDRVRASLVCTQLHTAALRAKMPSYIVATAQNELDAALDSPVPINILLIPQFRSLEITTMPRSPDTSITVYGKALFGSSCVQVTVPIHLTAAGTSFVESFGAAHIIANDKAAIHSYGPAQITATGNSDVHAHGSSQVNATDNAFVGAYKRAQVTASGQAKVYIHTPDVVVTTHDSAKITNCTIL